jgi:hypothetical protein
MICIIHTQKNRRDAVRTKDGEEKGKEKAKTENILENYTINFDARFNPKHSYFFNRIEANY